MSLYELIYIIVPTVSEKEIEEINEEIKKYFVEIKSFDKWGLKDFASEMRNHARGYYFVLNGKGEISKMQALREFLKLSKIVLRHSLFNVDNRPEIKPVEKKVEEESDSNV